MQRNRVITRKIIASNNKKVIGCRRPFIATSLISEIAKTKKLSLTT